VPNRQFEQHDFSVGEISPDHIWRVELAIRQRSLSTAANVRLLVSGSAQSRPATRRLATLPGDGLVIEVTIASDDYFLIFTAQALQVWNKATRTMVASFIGQPWIAEIVDLLTVVPHGSKIYVFYNIIQPRVIERSDAGVWSINLFTFASGIGNAVAQPYYRFADPGVTLTPSALGGVITCTASADYFVPNHVGAKLRLQNKEITVTGYTSPTVVTAICNQALLPTCLLTVTSSDGFEVGEVVAGKNSGATGQIIARPDSTHMTVLQDTFTGFSAEDIIGPQSVTPSSTNTLTTPGAVSDWTEAAMSDLRGWPGTGAVHRNRLCMGRFENIPFGICMSSVGFPTNCEVGANPQDAIFEELGDEATGIVQHIVSAEQLLVLTSRRTFYYPESENNPIAPATFELLQVGPDGASTCRPALISEGLLFGEAGGGSVLGVFPTGDVRRSWRVADLSRLSAHMIHAPRCIAYISGSPVDPSRYAYAVNTDGTLAVLTYSETDSDAVPGWTPWATNGSFRWIAANEGEAWAIVARVHVGTSQTVYSLEVFEEGWLVDSAVPLTGADLVGPASGQVINSPSGAQAAEVLYRCTALAGAVCSLVIGGDYIGEVQVDAAGLFGAPDLAGDIVIGFGFAARCVPWPPMDNEDQRSRRRKRRISGALIRYRGKGMAVNGKLRPNYGPTDDTSQASPERDELYRWPVFGWSQEPTIEIAKPYAAPWLLLGYSLEVST
jgi:hypothetical protein